jgi:predicted nucleic acid-binding Zn ribbon protein
MPTYEYRCANCGHQFEEFQSITGIIFKGGGFYETDYRSDSYKKAADAEKKGTEKPVEAKAAADAKPASSEASKSENSTEKKSGSVKKRKSE